MPLHLNAVSKLPDLETSRSAARGCIGFGVRKTARALSQLYDSVLALAGIKGTQFSVLNAIYLLRGTGIQRLSEVLGMDRTTLTRNLRPLTKQGLVAIRRGADRRERHLELTEEGRAKLAVALTLWQQVQTRLLDGYGPERSRHLLEELETLAVLAREG